MIATSEIPPIAWIATGAVLTIIFAFGCVVLSESKRLAKLEREERRKNGMPNSKVD